MADVDEPDGSTEGGRLDQADDNAPRRVLMVSAEMGEGHNAAGRALCEGIEESWPGCRVDWVDTMELAGPVFARVARWSYGFQVGSAPWSYKYSYDAISEWAPVAAASKALSGRFFGSLLARRLRGRRYDLIISTYPFGSAALDWLRRHRGLTTPLVTYIPALHVHPLWAYPGIDRHFVMYDTAARDAKTEGFERGMRIGAPPVRRAFGTIGRAEARRALDLRAEEFVVLVTGGAWGLGAVAEAVEGVHAVEPAVQVLAVAGKNTALELRLRALGRVGGDTPDGGRLRVLGFVDTMPELMAAADVVVTNGAGVTVLEALRTPRPVIAFAPLVGHGTASADELVGRDLALRADDVPALVEAVRRLRTDQTLLRRMERAGEEWVRGRDLRASLADMRALWLEAGAGPEVGAGPVVP